MFLARNGNDSENIDSNFSSAISYTNWMVVIKSDHDLRKTSNELKKVLFFIDHELLKFELGSSK